MSKIIEKELKINILDIDKITDKLKNLGYEIKKTLGYENKVEMIVLWTYVSIFHKEEYIGGFQRDDYENYYTFEEHWDNNWEEEILWINQRKHTKIIEQVIKEVNNAN